MLKFDSVQRSSSGFFFIPFFTVFGTSYRLKLLLNFQGLEYTVQLSRCFGLSDRAEKEGFEPSRRY